MFKTEKVVISALGDHSLNLEYSFHIEASKPHVVHFVWLVVIKVEMHVHAVGFRKIVHKFQILIELIFVDLNKVNLEVTFYPILADPTVLKFAVYLNIIFYLAGVK